MSDFIIHRDAQVGGATVAALRSAVGWRTSETEYQRVLNSSFANYCIFDSGELVCFLNVISDGVSYAFLTDLVVHPAHQRRRLGSAIVQYALNDLSTSGLRAVQAVHDPDLAPFYLAKGFSPLLAVSRRL